MSGQPRSARRVRRASPALAGALALLAGATPALAQAPAPAAPAPTPTADKDKDKVGVSTVAIAADRRAANALYKEGVRLFNAGQFADALDLFDNAYHRYPDARILYSMASTLRQLGKTVAAANAYQRYVDDPGAEPQFVAETKTVLHVLDATVGLVELTFEGDPGEVQVEDGQWMPLGTKSVRVDPGSFIIRARRTGATAEVTGRVAPGASTQISVKWTVTPEVKAPEVKPNPTDKPTGTGVVADLKQPPPPPAAKAPPYLAYGLGGGGVAFGVVAIVLELSSRSKISDAEAICGAALTCGEPKYSQATALLDGASSRRNGAIVFGTLATAGIAAGVYFYLQSKTPEKAHGADTALRVTPVTGDHSVGVLVDGSF